MDQIDPVGYYFPKIKTVTSTKNKNKEHKQLSLDI